MIRIIGVVAFMLFGFASVVSRAATPGDIKTQNARAIVYIQIENATGAYMGSGTGFIVSHDGYVVTAAHVEATKPGQKVVAVIGQNDGTRLTLTLRGIDAEHDTAIWQLPQSATCRYAATLSNEPVHENDRVLGIGFPGKDGLTATPLNIVNLSSSDRDCPKADGFLRGGYAVDRSSTKTVRS